MSTTLPLAVSRTELTSIAQARALMRELLGAFWEFNPHDPEIYITHLVSLMTKYPLPVAQRAITAAVNRCKRPPAPAELRELLDAQMAETPAATLTTWISKDDTRWKALDARFKRECNPVGAPTDKTGGWHFPAEWIDGCPDALGPQGSMRAGARRGSVSV